MAKRTARAAVSAAGRPSRPEGTERITTTVPGGYKERLRQIGNGSISEGIVKVVDAFERRSASGRA